MRVLVACERSGRVRDAFLARGHDAISCDIMPTDIPGPHIQGDVRPYLRERWDMVIAHPECTFLTNAAAKHLYVGQRRFNPDGTENPLCPERVSKCAEAAAFFLECLNANAPRVAVENPVMHWLAIALTRTNDARQTVQPWWFGDRTFKATTFRLRGLGPLAPTDKLSPPKAGTDEHKRWSWVFRCPPGPDRSRIRAQTQPGVAAAIADQWGASDLVGMMEAAE